MINEKNNLKQARYIELLKKNYFLISEKQSSLYKENRKQHRELLLYGVILSNHVVYERRDEYIFLVEKYLTNEICSLSLQFKFFEI